MLPWSKVFRITRACKLETPWTTSKPFRQVVSGKYSWMEWLVHNLMVCSCKISILIRKTATAVRIAGWNRRRIIIETLLLLHFRGSFVAPLLLCVPDDRVSTFRTQWSGSNCGYYDDTATHCPQSFLRFMQSLRYIQILWSKSFLKPWRFYI